eukprot:8676128-Ditylum_brightwellii.AAC.1
MGRGEKEQSGWSQGKALMHTTSISRLDKCIRLAGSPGMRSNTPLEEDCCAAAALIPRAANTADLAEGMLGGGNGGVNAVLVDSGTGVSSQEHAHLELHVHLRGCKAFGAFATNNRS